MLYAIGLVTIWKHVGHRLYFKDGDGTGNIIAALMANEVIPQYLTSPLPFGSQIPNKSDHQKVVEYENKRVLAAKRKAEASKDRAVRKRDATEGASQRTKKRKTAPLSFALSLFESRNKLSDDYKALQQVHLGCVEKEADLTEKLVAVEKERDDLLDKDREREERIRQLEADLASKTFSLTEAKGVVRTLKGDLERLTIDLSHAEIVRHNYVRQLLPTVFQRLLSSDEYKKIISDVFNLAIAAGWSEGAKAACSEEEA
nr:hypothetical protein [Tanacetum cinerariifolium]